MAYCYRNELRNGFWDRFWGRAGQLFLLSIQLAVLKGKYTSKSVSVYDFLREERPQHFF